MRNPALSMAALVVLAACNPRFVADFEADTPGAPPAAQPPGPPDDQILIDDSNVRGAGVVIRVTDEPQLVAPGAPHRFMSLIHDPDPGLSSIASLRTAAMATSTQPIFLQWAQVLDGGGQGTIYLFALPDRPTADVDVCIVFTGNDVVTLECDVPDAPTASVEVEGIDTHRQHVVLMRLDRSPRRAAIQVSQDGVTTASEVITSMAVPAPVEGQRLVAQIEYDGQSDGAYRFNRFAVQELDPN